MRYRYAVAALVAVGALLLGGCSNYTEPFKDADRGKSDDSPADILLMPNGFSNIASKCDGPNRVYSIYHGDNPYGAVAVAPNDPRCNEEQP
jgi:hypothetical protein